MSYPNMFVVGAAKAATTSLYRYFANHPAVYVCPIKEPHFFATDFNPAEFNPIFRRNVTIDMRSYLAKKPLPNLHLAFVHSDKDYQALFAASNSELVLSEFSTGYLYSTKAASAIAAKRPDAKIIMVLRDPIERAFSHYLMNVRSGWVDRPFAQSAITDYEKEVKGWGISSLYIDLGLYSSQVKRFLDHFGPRQVCILLFEDLVSDYSGTLAKICSFLGLNCPPLAAAQQHSNRAMAPKYHAINRFVHYTGIAQTVSSMLPKGLKEYLKSFLFSFDNLPVLTSQDREQLLGYFKSDINSLQQLIQRDLSSWLAIEK